MSRKKIVAGNWKMNTDLSSALDLVTALKQQASSNPSITKIIFPPFPFLQTMSEALYNVSGFYVGAQNCSQHEKGAYTGEVSAAMLRSVGCEYVLTGHSERRMYFHESNHELLGKINQALAGKLKVIFCFGEQLQERKDHKHFATVENQLVEVLSHLSSEKIKDLILAYEPVWAIGTGETASPAQAQEMHAFVRSVTAKLFSKEIADGISILYGGSCNAQNAAELFACSDVDGGLIGGASLKAEDFCKIITALL